MTLVTLPPRSAGFLEETLEAFPCEQATRRLVAIATDNNATLCIRIQHQKLKHYPRIEQNVQFVIALLLHLPLPLLMDDLSDPTTSASAVFLKKCNRNPLGSSWTFTAGWRRPSSPPPDGEGRRRPGRMEKAVVAPATNGWKENDRT